ncbi:MAG: Arm DNA-binding domain-containing protein, partial [Bacteroidota bacterium]
KTNDMSINPSVLLKKPSKTTGLSLIYLQAKWNGNRLLYSSRENISPSLWDRKKQIVKNNQATTKDGLHFINDLISNMKTIVIKAYHKEAANGAPTVQQIRAYLDEFFEKNEKEEKLESGKPTLFQLIDKFIANEILYKGKQKAEGTIKSYRTTKRHLLEFEKKTGYKLRYDTITLDFFYKWISYLRTLGSYN